MKRAALLLALAATACAPAPRDVAGPPPPRRDSATPRGNPSALIAAEVAFNQLAQASGQWQAFRETAADTAVMFTPQPVNALAWLKGRADPPARLTWQPHQAWISCDGSLGLTKGAWQRGDGASGYFTTLWQRDPKAGYKWVLDQGDDLSAPLAPPEMISGKVADCTGEPGAIAADAPVGAQALAGSSGDRTLQWSALVRGDGSRVLSVSLWRGGQMQEVLRSEVTPR